MPTAIRSRELAHGQLQSYHGNNAETAPEKYMGNYDLYLDRIRQLEAAAVGLETETAESSYGSSAQAGPSASADAPPSDQTGGVDDWKKRKEEQARRRKLENDLRKCEAEISRLEEEGALLDDEISLPENSTDPDKLRDLTSKREAVDEKLAELYEQWESLSELAEE